MTSVVGAQVEPAPSNVAVDGDGNPVADVLIFFDATGERMIANSTAITGANGMASVGDWTLGARAGTQTIAARSLGLEEVVFTAVALPGPVTSMKLMSGNNQLETAGYLLRQRLQVRVADAFGQRPRGRLTDAGLPSPFGITRLAHRSLFQMPKVVESSLLSPPGTALHGEL